MDRWLLQSLLVGAGGFAGAVLRYGVQTLVLRHAPLSVFPYGTLVVNLLGCLAIGALAGLTVSRDLFSEELRSLIFVGLLGGFTTFSAFGYETFALIRDGEYPSAAAYAALHLVLGLGLVWLAYRLVGAE